MDIVLKRSGITGAIFQFWLNRNYEAAGAVEVYLDGGIRRGTDALKATACGARAVCIGRPVK